uniref:Uncharacterized protein n=1 Tax=Rhizophora mucronata TaxID=61149 RepID=A0A2P2PED1_RHIMU
MHTLFPWVLKSIQPSYKVIL